MFMMKLEKAEEATECRRYRQQRHRKIRARRGSHADRCLNNCSAASTQQWFRSTRLLLALINYGLWGCRLSSCGGNGP